MSVTGVLGARITATREATVSYTPPPFPAQHDPSQGHTQPYPPQYAQQPPPQQYPQQQLMPQYAPPQYALPPQYVVHVPVQVKDTAVTYLLWFFLGALGIHRFYLRQTGLGILYLFTVGIFGLGILVDLFAIPGAVRRANYEISVGIR